jgi:hypothetical protein
MNLTPILLTLRALALMFAAGFAAVELRNYLASRWGMPISSKPYAALAILFILFVYSLSMQSVMRELRADAEVRRLQIPAEQFNAGEGRTETVHRYPWLLRYPVVAVGLFYVAIPFLRVEPGKSSALVTYAGCFGIAFFVFAIAFYLFTYSVTVKHDGILVNAFGKREISFSDVADTKLVRTALGRQIVLRLKNGQVFRFGGKLTGFLTLLDALTARAPTPSTPTTK